MERVTGQAGIQALLTGASREDAGSSVHVGLFESLRDCSLRESKLPRKEVIQPQVPLRLPCYDFTPITTRTLGSSIPCGLGHRLLVRAAFVA